MDFVKWADLIGCGSYLDIGRLPSKYPAIPFASVIDWALRYYSCTLFRYRYSYPLIPFHSPPHNLMNITH